MADSSSQRAVAPLEDNLGAAASRYDSPEGGGRKKKNSLSGWGQFKTVSWRVDAKKDFDEHTSVVMMDESWYSKAKHEIWSWGIPALVGVATATSGAFIEKNVEWFGAWRLGYCTAPPYVWSTPENCKDNWVSYDSLGYSPLVPYFIFIVICTIIAALSATLTWAFAPMSRGSGIPEIKTILGGFTFPEVLAGNTLVIKIIGLSMSVGAGLSCGKEGPLVHIACCWSNFFSKWFARYRDNEAKQRELISSACACGVAVAFGAPLGGVLFSLEEASTIFPNRVMLRSFFGASIAAMTLAAWNPTGSGKLTMFNAPYSKPPPFHEYPVIILLGIVGGMVGAFFVHWNIQVSKNRAPGTWFRKKCHIVLEVALISFFTAITSYHLLWTRVLSNVTIRALFHMCDDHDIAGDLTEWRHNYMLDLCDGDAPATDAMLCVFLFLTGFLRLVQMIFTFGTGAAAGLFIPSLLAGAALGRIVGIGLYVYYGGGIYPGMYAMLGAAAVLGGVCRVTISLVVIMFELTGGLQLIVPFMVVCTLAKWVGDYFTIGIYDYIIVIRKYPYLHEPDEVTFNAKAKDVMDECIDCLHPESGTVGGLLKFLKNAKHGGYPLTQSPTDPTLLGYLHTNQLISHLEKQLAENAFVQESTKVWFCKYVEGKKPSNVMDLSKLVDECVTVVVAETPAAQLQTMFRNLGLKIILVRHKAELLGIITKKSFITNLEEIHHGGHAHTSQSGLQQPLLPK
eukprot:TRINITY_DN5409_c2_g3_i1.p1 TRINITY_DN5409_c2_g3~~TRINITY_DN5409_c2_g3_i1.p1  ORF type:complete len:736 (+),score=128.75 TRINITY_DN5409_c2_g3_i1:93-2300(+)